ncbi:MAG: hypothetical protein HRT72_02910, partial [Flavobacteriales bacterium]|nr:hypothetical protein [Flavobacteriales bacterium]
MKKIIFIVVGALLGLSTLAIAGGKYGATAADSIICIEALNLYGDDYKAKNY